MAPDPSVTKQVCDNLVKNREAAQVRSPPLDGHMGRSAEREHVEELNHG